MNMVKDGKVVCTEDQYREQIAEYSEEKLEYVMADCKAAISANPENPNCDYYRQEIKLIRERLNEFEFKRLQAFEISVVA